MLFLFLNFFVGRIFHMLGYIVFHHYLIRSTLWLFVMFVQNNDGSQKISGEALKDLYKAFVADYPIVSIEDPFDQDDWEHYSKLTCEIGAKVQIVGDDLLVTNPKVSPTICLSQTHNSFSVSLSLSCSLFLSHSLSLINAFLVHRGLQRQLRRKLAMPFFLRSIKSVLSLRVLRP